MRVSEKVKGDKETKIWNRSFCITRDKEKEKKLVFREKEREGKRKELNYWRKI